jgi:hypothetical protein
MYMLYDADDRPAGSRYVRWVVSPARVAKLEYNDKTRMVKVILGTFGVRELYFVRICGWSSELSGKLQKDIAEK